MTRITKALIAAKELGDEKMHIVIEMQDLIEGRTMQLDDDFKNLDYADDVQQDPTSKQGRSASPTSSTQGGARHEFGAYGPSTSHQRGSTPTSQNSERNSSNGERNINGKRSRRPKTDADNDSSENGSSNKNNGNTNGSLNVTGGAAGSSKNIKGGQNSGNSSKQKKKRKSRQGREREESPPPDQIDPDEPTYCLCDQVKSY